MARQISIFFSPNYLISGRLKINKGSLFNNGVPFQVFFISKSVGDYSRFKLQIEEKRITFFILFFIHVF